MGGGGEHGGERERERERKRERERERYSLVQMHLNQTVHSSHTDKFITHLSYLATASL